MPVLCVKISTPLTFCAFQNWPPKIKPLRELNPHPPPNPPSRDVINDRSLSGQDRKIPLALHGTNQIAGFGGFRPLASLEENEHVHIFFFFTIWSQDLKKLKLSFTSNKEVYASKEVKENALASEGKSCRPGTKIKSIRLPWPLSLKQAAKISFAQSKRT